MYITHLKINASLGEWGEEGYWPIKSLILVDMSTVYKKRLVLRPWEIQILDQSELFSVCLDLNLPLCIRFDGIIRNTASALGKKIWLTYLGPDNRFLKRDQKSSVSLYSAVKLRPNSHRTPDATRSKWDLLSSMGVFTLHASKIKGKTFQYACASHRASCWIRPDQDFVPLIAASCGLNTTLDIFFLFQIENVFSCVLSGTQRIRITVQLWYQFSRCCCFVFSAITRSRFLFCRFFRVFIAFRERALWLLAARVQYRQLYLRPHVRGRYPRPSHQRQRPQNGKCTGTNHPIPWRIRHCKLPSELAVRPWLTGLSSPHSWSIFCWKPSSFKENVGNLRTERPNVISALHHTFAPESRKIVENFKIIF